MSFQTFSSINYGYFELTDSDAVRTTESSVTGMNVQTYISSSDTDLGSENYTALRSMQRHFIHR